jgi:hypothetical protein
MINPWAAYFEFHQIYEYKTKAESAISTHFSVNCLANNIGHLILELKQR